MVKVARYEYADAPDARAMARARMLNAVSR
jgi:hypothetical protein